MTALSKTRTGRKNTRCGWNPTNGIGFLIGVLLAGACFQVMWCPLNVTIAEEQDRERFLVLPPEFRHAPKESCHGGGTNYAPATIVSKVPKEKAIALASGGFEVIQQGSGNVELVGLMVLFLSNLQHDRGIFGSVGELGVHHGRFTSTLFITARSTEKLIVADVFEQEGKNIDLSGLGDKEKFMEGLTTYGLSENALHLVHTGSTEEIPFDWFLQKNFEPFRLISIDAGHTAPLTFNDLELAFCNSLKGAVVVIDDVFHPHWPGVTEGLFHFFAYKGLQNNIYPFLACENKLFLTNDFESYQTYYNIIKSDSRVNLFVETNTRRWGGSAIFTFNSFPTLICHRESRVDVKEQWRSLVK